MALEQNDLATLRAEQLRLAYRNVPQGILGFLATLLALLLILNSVVAWIWLALWSAIALANAGVRYHDARRFWILDPGPADLPKWLPRFQEGLLLTGIVWGGAGVILFPAWSPAGQVFLAFVLGGMATGAVGTYSALPGASPRFFIPAILPIIIRLLLAASRIEIAMALLMVVYILLIWQVSQRIHGALRDSLTLQLENRRLLSDLAAARLTEERTAARIQQVLLYGSLPTGIPDVSMGALVVSSKAVGGDFYDFFPVSEGVIDILVGDVMGKGVPAALIGAGAKSRFQKVLASYRSVHGSGPAPDPARIVADVRDRLTSRLDELESFITLCYARLDLEERRLVYVNCGHLPPIRLAGGSGSIHYLGGREPDPARVRCG